MFIQNFFSVLPSPHMKRLKLRQQACFYPIIIYGYDIDMFFNFFLTQHDF